MSLSTKINRYGIIQVAVWLVVAVAAVNWGTAEFLDINLVAALLPPSIEKLTYGVIAAAGAANIVELVTDFEVIP
jgi:uncharacterized membrane protein YuzA (DUF378 family)